MSVLIILEQKPFESHSAYLPQLTLLLVDVQLALALVVKDKGYLKRGVAMIVADDNGMLAAA